MTLRPSRCMRSVLIQPIFSMMRAGTCYSRGYPAYEPRIPILPTLPKYYSTSYTASRRTITAAFSSDMIMVESRISVDPMATAGLAMNDSCQRIYDLFWPTPDFMWLRKRAPLSLHTCPCARGSHPNRRTRTTAMSGKVSADIMTHSAIFPQRSLTCYSSNSGQLIFAVFGLLPE